MTIKLVMAVGRIFNQISLIKITAFLCIVIFCRPQFAYGINIDNQLVTSNYDCFERIALGAMLPFNVTFRDIDTNLLKVCEDMCAREGDRCQTFAFGIHLRGNGTCQLSSKKIDATRARPVGTVFDPDFDLYARKTNCVIDPTMFNEPFSRPGIGDLMNVNNQPGSSLPSMRPTFPTLPDRTQPPPLLHPLSTTEDDLSFSPIGITFGSSTYGSSLPPALPTASSLNQTTINGIPPELYPSSNRFPMGTMSTADVETERYPPDRMPAYPRPDHHPSNNNNNNGNDQRPRPGLGTTNGNSLSQDKVYRYPYNGYGNRYPDYNYDANRVSIYGNRYGDLYPTYNYPMLYEQNYPMPNDKNPLPNSYAQNVPSVDEKYKTPMSNGNGYGTSPSSPSSSNNGNYNANKDRYNYNAYGLGGNSGVNERPDPYRPSTTNSNANGNGYDNKKPTTDNTNKYRPTEEPIEIYFNPEDYYGPKPPCFRRVLAGKRVAPQWIRRTLVCERVDDCQRECGEEKRFTCEGFNYRIDPTGRAQGDCELIEIPLAQMDLYSSPISRDSHLQQHPDYDYYERDRSSSPNCKSTCINCSLKPSLYRPQAIDYYRPNTGSNVGGYRPFNEYSQPPIEKYRPQTTAVDKYRPQIYDTRPGSEYNRYDSSQSHHYSSSSGGDSYRRPSNNYQKPGYGGSEIDRYDFYRPSFGFKPSLPDIPASGYGDQDNKPSYPLNRPPADFYRPDDIYRPDPLPSRPQLTGGGSSYGSHGNIYRPPTRPPNNYLDREPVSYNKPFVPYLIGQGSSWGVYGGSYGTGPYSSYGTKPSQEDYWGIKSDHRRKDGQQFNYYDLGHKVSQPEENSVWSYPGSRYNGWEDRERIKSDYGSQWTRRPGQDECSVKSSEGFRLHKGIIKFAYNAPSVRECEQMCHNENKFKCFTYSYRYSPLSHDNCLLCDRPYNLLDYYADVEPDRDYDIYSMSDDPKMCLESKINGNNNRNSNAQCFFRAADSSRFFKSIIRASIKVRSIGECELECIKSSKFTCRAFSYKYGGAPTDNAVVNIENCQMSDWPVRDMDKERHFVTDTSFDIFERASYGNGCEIQPIVDDKNKKLCYLGYGSPAKLLSSAIKKVITVPTELECKNECIRFRENTPFKCYSFSFGSHKSSYNCEMSDLDQGELKMNIHYAHTSERDYWLFAWNPFDWTCRDKVTTIGGSSTGINRDNHDRRMDIFREPGEVTWQHFTVTGKPCRIGSQCLKNIVTGFYSCEIDGGEVGSWDYCCRTDHPCGYSQGFQYPWCFVGDKLDQWRQCSDRYYPIQTVSASTNHIIKGTASTVGYIKDKNKKGEFYQSPPRPGGLQNLEEIREARLWPITYLYTDNPPNSTDLISNAIDCKKDKC